MNFQLRLEHILERIVLISEAENTEKPSAVTISLFVGGALAARSIYTLQRLRITHILCLCTNEIGQADSQFPDLFAYKNFSVSHILMSHHPIMLLTCLQRLSLCENQLSYCLMSGSAFCQLCVHFMQDHSSF